MKNTIKNIAIVVLALMVMGGFILAGGGNYNNYSSFFNRSSGALILVNATDTIGNTSNRIAEIWGTLLNVSGESQLDTIVQGGDVTIIGYGTTTASAAEICDNSIIKIGFLADAMATLTLPATTTLHADCLGANGKHKVVLLKNVATSTLALTIIEGAGLDLESDDNTGDIIAAGASAELEFWRETSAVTTVIIRPFLNAD